MEIASLGLKFREELLVPQSKAQHDSFTVQLSPVFLLFGDECLPHSFLSGSIALPEPNSRNGCRPDPLFFPILLFFLLAVRSLRIGILALYCHNVFAEFVEYLSCNQLRQLDLTKASVCGNKP